MLRIRALSLATAVAAFLCGAAHAVPPTHSDIAYSSNWRQRLDLYIPTGDDGPYPVVVYIHGGGWLTGDKDDAETYSDEMLARGIAVAAINYRFSYQAAFPVQLHDCKGAIRFLRANADAYDIDPDLFAVFGESAGGHLASLVATTGDDAALEGSVGGNVGLSSSVVAFVHGYGPTDLMELALFSPQRGSEISALIGHNIYDIIANQNNPAYSSWLALVNSANPATHAAPTDPPSYIVHGDMDDVVPIEQSELFADALQQAGAPETFRRMDGIGHVIPDSELPAIFNFLEDHLVNPLPEPISFGGDDANESFGHSVASIGDVNNDGIGDLLVGAPFNDDKGADAGRVTVFSGADNSVLRILRGRAAGDRFGFAVAGCGDLNSDGRADFIVGAPTTDPNGKQSGRVEVYAGGTWQRLRALDGSAAGDQFGYAVASADVNGDGAPDIICGTPFSDVPAANAGSVSIYSGSNGSLLRLHRGKAKNDRFGWAVDSAGDVNGDGRDDVIIGAPLSDTAGINGGSFTVIGLNGSNWVTRLTRHGVASEQLGSAVAGVGDQDGDGLADVAAGAPHGRATDNVASGIVRVYSPVSKALITTIEPSDPQDGEGFGSTVAAGRDMDGDDLQEILIGSPTHDGVGLDSGRGFVFNGIGIVIAEYTGSAAGSRFGTAMARGLSNAPDLNEIVVAASDMYWNSIRRGVVYILVVEVSP